MNDKNIINASTKGILDEERKNERIIHLARISLFSLVLVVMGLSRLTLGEELNLRFILVSLFSISCIGYSATNG